MTTSESLAPIATRYVVRVLPIGDERIRYFCVYLERRPGGSWVVTDGATPALYIDADGVCTYRDDDEDLDDWKARAWHTFEAAVKLAQDAARAIARDVTNR